MSRSDNLQIKALKSDLLGEGGASGSELLCWKPHLSAQGPCFGIGQELGVVSIYNLAMIV